MRANQSNQSVSNTIQRNKREKLFIKWKKEEQLLYAAFLAEHADKLLCEFNRRSSRVFSLMSDHLKSRNSEQCRTHHQKMVKKYQTVHKIIEGLHEKYKIDYHPTETDQAINSETIDEPVLLGQVSSQSREEQAPLIDEHKTEIKDQSIEKWIDSILSF